MNTTQIEDPADRPTEGETAEELIVYALSERQALTRAQLDRRHRARIIPRPKLVVRRGGKGTMNGYDPPPPISFTDMTHPFTEMTHPASS